MRLGEQRSEGAGLGRKPVSQRRIGFRLSPAAQLEVVRKLRRPLIVLGGRGGSEGTRGKRGASPRGQKGPAVEVTLNSEDFLEAEAVDVLNCREEGADPGGRKLRGGGGLRLLGVGVGWEGPLRVVEDWVQAWATSGLDARVTSRSQLPVAVLGRLAGTQPFGMPRRGRGPPSLFAVAPPSQHPQSMDG